MHFRKSKNTLAILLFIAFNIFNSYSQTNSEIDLYNRFDSIVGKENLDINNGPLYTNPYKTIGDNNMFFVGDKFEKGTLFYEGLLYYNIGLKYDIYKDILIINPKNTQETIGISLIKKNVDYFLLNNLTFTKVNKEQYSLPNFTTGYYETSKYNDTFIFYIKYSKLIQKKISDDEIYYTFKPNNSYFLAYKKTLYAVDKKSDIIKLFPTLKKQINEFYITNSKVKSSDINQFMKNLMKYINSLSNQIK